MVENWKVEKLKKSQYRVIGNHSAVKICMWTKEALRGGRACYKNTFYGIDTAGCLEMSPALTCNQRCLHCWRDTSIFSREWEGPVDEPDDIITGCIEERKKLLMGFGGNDKTDPKQFQQALEPKQVAISLTGEPCMYPKLPELIDRFFERGFESVFLVTSGTVPEMLKKFNRLPTNLYISVTASNPELYSKLCKPVMKNGWEKMNESLEIMSSIDTVTVMRLTLIEGLNMHNPKELIPLIEKAKPTYIEAKAYMFLGYSRQRLKQENMPSYESVKKFAEAIEANSDYKICNERADSRVILLKL